MFDSKEETTVNQGEGSLYIENNPGTVNVYLGKSLLSNEELLLNINRASVDLYGYENQFQGKVHIDRRETAELYKWVIKEFSKEESRISLLVGNAGYGKSVVLKDLLELLNNNDIPTLGIKADKVINIGSLRDIESELNLQDSILSIFQNLSESNPLVVLIIDQIDALSQSLSSNRHAINSYDRLIKQLEIFPNIRIVISCRTYDLDYDPTLRSYKGKEIFKILPLDLEQVNLVLTSIGIKVNDNNVRLKEFLRVPLHLNLFCKVGLNKQFDDSITLQKLYDEIWEESITNNNTIDPIRVVELLTLIADKMHEQQHIVVDKRLFNLYSKEIHYLLHQDLLKESTSNKIQFIHQTFFDYVYARTFITSDKSIAEWLKNVHQGLFIRSQVKQIFSYLRDLNASLYIRELKEILLGKDYRFHIQLLLINDLGFYHNPLPQERKLVIDHIVKHSLFFRIFLESIQSPEWFKYIIQQDEFKEILSKNDNESDIVISNLCSRVIWQDALLVVSFLTEYPQKIKLIENILMQIPESQASLAQDLYDKTSSKWNADIRCYYIEKILKSDPDFVIAELKKNFDENISKVGWFDDNYIPEGYNGFKIYGDIYEQYPNKIIPHFIYTLEKIAKSKQYESSYGLYGDHAFYLYKPHASKEEIHNYKSLYNIILHSIKDNVLDEYSTSIIIGTLNSQHANIFSIGIYYLLQNVKAEINRIFYLFSTDKFFIKIDSSEILSYYSKELLVKSYPLLTEERQAIVNQSILSTLTNFHYGDYKADYTERKIYSNYLQHTYRLISMLPEEHRDKYVALKKLYQEGYRKYGRQANIEPQEVSVSVGYTSYSQKAYENMSFTDWQKTFKKLSKEEHSFDSWYKPSKEGNIRAFEEHVSKNPDEFYPFIENLINEKNISIDYILAGLEGLSKANYCKNGFQNLCLNILTQRRGELNESNTYLFLWALKSIVRDNAQLDKVIFDFIKDVIYQFPDKEVNVDLATEKDIGMVAINTGINSTRGAAVELILDCYLLTPYKDEIFETLEFVADNANEATRACAIFKGAWLNHLDKKRAFDLYLRLVKDYNPLLLSMPSQNHPLLYHVNTDFKNLEDFFNKAIMIKEAGKSMAFFLFSAYLNGKPKGYALLKTLLDNNPLSRPELASYICASILSNKKHAKKGWNIINYLLVFDDEALGKKMNNCFLRIPSIMDSQLVAFLNRYLNSPIEKYKDNYFYDFLRKLVPSDSHQCLKWFFESKPDKFKHDFYVKSPINILIEGYNGVREFEMEDSILEKAMDTFDSLLQTPQYRNVHLRSFLQELAS